MTPIVIHVAPIGRVPSATLSVVETRAGAVFDAAARTRQVNIDVDAAFDAARKQHNSTLLLAALYEQVPDDGSKLIGITDLDLFVPVLTFVFGEAQLGGRVAVASLFRLHNRLYGLPDNADLLHERLEKEAVHELGHAFGLRHCINPMCVMHASNSVEEVDVKSSDLCRACRGIIGLEER